MHLSLQPSHPFAVLVLPVFPLPVLLSTCRNNRRLRLGSIWTRALKQQEITEQERTQPQHLRSSKIPWFNSVFMCGYRERGRLRVNLLSHNNPEGGTAFLSCAHLLLSNGDKADFWISPRIQALYRLILRLSLENFLVNNLMDDSACCILLDNIRPAAASEFNPFTDK